MLVLMMGLGLLIFVLGLLVGSSMNTHAQEMRDRRQARVQRQLNDEWSQLRAQSR